MVRLLLAAALALLQVAAADAQVGAIRKAKEGIEKHTNYSFNYATGRPNQIGKVEQMLTLNLSKKGGTLHVDYRLYAGGMRTEHKTGSVLIEDLDSKVEADKSRVTLYTKQKDKVTYFENIGGAKDGYKTDTLVIHAKGRSSARDLAEAFRILITAKR